MKKSTFLKSAILTAVIFTSAIFSSINAQISTFPWTEDFGNPSCTLPAGFSNGGTDPWDFQNTSETYMEGTDHTTGSGCFASMDDSGGSADDTCELTTPAFDLTAIPTARLNFWWQNSNSTTSTPHTTGPRNWSNLNVDVSTNGGTTWNTNVFTIVDSQQIGWALADVDLSPYISANTVIRIRGLETQSFRSDLSLDDLTIFEPAALDVTVVGISGLDGICPGSVPVSATVENLGLNTITSLTVNWSLNGVTQTPVSYTGSIPYLGTDVVSLGSFTAATATLYDVKVWTSAPNAGTDQDTLNDTLAVNGIETGMQGTYTVGLAGDYLNLVNAVNDLNTRGICGAVTFNVDPGTYPGRLDLGIINGASATNTVTFNGNGATVSESPTSTDRYVIRLNGAQYVTLDSLNIVGTGTTYGYGVLLQNSADFNTIQNCTIDLTAVTSTSSINSTGILASGSETSTSTAGNNANFCTISNNTILGGTTGVYYGIRLNGNIGAQDCVGNQIIGNTVQDIYAYNIYLDDTDSNLVSGNDISRPTKTSVTTFYGIYVTGGRNNLIEKNRVHNTHDAASSLTGSSYAVYFSSADAPAGKPNVVANNLFYNFNSNGTVYAIYNFSSDSAEYYHNTISLDDTNATGGTTRGFYQTTTADGIIFQNNLISITRGGSSDKHGVYFNSNTSTILSENNIIYVNSKGSGSQYTGTWDGIDYTSMTNWRGANFGAFDQQSDDGDPMFADVSVNDYTPGTSSGNNIGAALGFTEDFFGNTRNLTTPDPGAIEFIAIPSNDSCAAAITIAAGITAGTTIDATTDSEASCVVGNDPSGGVWYRYTANGDFITASLCGASFDTRIRVYSGTCGSLVCETGNEDSCATQSVVGWCSMDTTDYYILVYGNNSESGTFDLEITETPVAIPTITALSDTSFCDGDSVVLESSPSAMYSWSDINASTNRTLTLFATDSVTVTTTDSNGCIRTSEIQKVILNPLPQVDLGPDTTICEDESITLDAGPGASYNWSIGGSTQTITFDGSNGTSTVSVDVTDANGCIGTDEIEIEVEICSGIETVANSKKFSLFPNPNNGIVTLSFEENSTNRIALKIYDIQGKTVYVEEFYMNNSNRKQLNLENLPKGFYTMVVQDENAVQTAKLIIQ